MLIGDSAHLPSGTPRRLADDEVERVVFSLFCSIIAQHGSGWVTGGPPGLQIRSAGANHVRGRFDSYTFPPLRALSRNEGCHGLRREAGRADQGGRLGLGGRLLEEDVRRRLPPAAREHGRRRLEGVPDPAARRGCRRFRAGTAARAPLRHHRPPDEGLGHGRAGRVRTAATQEVARTGPHFAETLPK